MSLIKPDLCVIGSTPGGVFLATAAAAFGVPVVLVESPGPAGLAGGGDPVGLAALAAAAGCADAIGNGRAFGFGPLLAEIDASSLREHVGSVMATSRLGSSAARLAALGVTVIQADARFVDRRTLQVGGHLIHARRFVVAVGSRLAIPDIPGLDSVPFLTPDTVLALNRRPKRFIVLGGSADALVLAQSHARLGTQVTLVVDGNILPGHDPEAVAFVRRGLLRDGVDLHEDTQVTHVKAVARNALVLSLEGQAGASLLEASHILVATGAVPLTDALDCAAAGVRTDASHIVVDARMRSANRRIHAIGACIQGMSGGNAQSIHAAQAQARVVLRNVLFRQRARYDAKAIPHVVLTDPGIASVGLGESEARAAHAGVQSLRWPFSENDRARAAHRMDGLVKVVADRKGIILGAAIAGPDASELITPWTLAVSQRLTMAQMADIAVPAATFSDVTQKVASSFLLPMASRPSVRRLVGFLRRFG